MKLDHLKVGDSILVKRRVVVLALGKTIEQYWITERHEVTRVTLTTLSANIDGRNATFSKPTGKMRRHNEHPAFIRQIGSPQCIPFVGNEDKETPAARQEEILTRLKLIRKVFEDINHIEYRIFSTPIPDIRIKLSCASPPICGLTDSQIENLHSHILAIRSIITEGAVEITRRDTESKAKMLKK